MSLQNKITLKKIILFFVCLVPSALIIGAAVAELFVSLASLTFLYYVISSKDWYYFKRKIILILAIFSFYNILNSLFSEFPINSLRSSFFYFRFFIFITAIWYLMDYEKKFVNYFLLSIMLPLSIASLFSLYQVFDPDLEKARLLDFRISGFFGSELIQGSYFLRLLTLCTGLYFYLFNQKDYLFYYLIFIIVCSFIIIISGERSAVGLLLIFITLFIIFIDINFLSKIKYIIFIITFLVAIVLNLPGLKERLYDNTMNLLFEENKLQAFSRGHQEHYISALKMFQDNKITGVGVRNFRLECRKPVYKDIGVNACTTHPHNTYIQLLAETGIIGFTFVLVLFASILKFLIKNMYIVIFKRKKINLFKTYFAVAIFINLFPFVPTGSFFNNWLSILYFLPLAFYYYNPRKN